MYPKPIENRSVTTRNCYKIGVFVALLVWLLPLGAMFMTSFRSLADINMGNFWGIPTEWMILENYTGVFKTTPMGQFLINSLLISVPTVIGSLTISVFAAFALAKYRFKSNTFLFTMFIAGNFIPFQILMIPVRDLTVSMGMYDSIPGLVLFHIAFQSGFCTFFLRNFIKALPNSLIEAGRCDGASEMRIFFTIIMPLIRPALAALAVLIFTFIWNDYFWALVLVQSDSVRPVTAGLEALKGQWTASWQMISAGSIIAALPPVAMFFAMQKHFIAGLTLGSTKG